MNRSKRRKVVGVEPREGWAGIQEGYTGPARGRRSQKPPPLRDTHFHSESRGKDVTLAFIVYQRRSSEGSKELLVGGC